MLCACAGGALSGKYLNGCDTSRSRHTKFPGFQPRYHAKRTSDAARELVEIGKAQGLSAATVAQAWAASRWAVLGCAAQRRSGAVVCSTAVQWCCGQVSCAVVLSQHCEAVQGVAAG